jgi:hypothetical protein
VSPLFRKVLAKLAALPIREHYLDSEDDPDERIYGMLDGNVIHINPAMCIGEVLIHEALHAVNRDWSEATVSRLTSRLVSELSHEEWRALWDIYQGKRQQSQFRR